MRRTGLDYWKDVDVRVWESYADLQLAAGDSARFWYLSTKARRGLWEVPFVEGDYLVFGSEGKGLPEQMVIDAADQALRIPMREGSTRSLNLSTAVAIVLYEAVRQVGF